MFFIIPIGSEEGVRKWPVLTLTLIGLNAVIWVITSLVMSQQIREIERIDQKLRDIEYRYVYRIVESDPQELVMGDYEVVREKFRAGEVLMPDDPYYEEWHVLYNELNTRINNSVFQKFGFIPKKFNILTMFTSLFIHGNIFHLVFNMLFLWLVGCNIADDWSWKIFGGLYVFSGLVACSLHWMVYPASTMPLIGASGAIAGVMGAFMIRHFKTKIAFVYFIWLFIRPFFGRFRIYAGIALPIWFLQQILSASWSSETGVAYYAHIGGFVLGAVIGASFKFLGIEKKYIAPMVEESFEKLKLSPLMKEGYKKLEAGENDAAREFFQKALESEPDNFDARLVLARMNTEKKLVDEAILLYEQALEIAMRASDFQTVLAIKDELAENKLFERFSEKNLYALATLLESRARYADAAALYETHLSRYPHSMVRAKVLRRASLLYKAKLNNARRAEELQGMLKQEGFELSQ